MKINLICCLFLIPLVITTTVSVQLTFPSNTLSLPQQEDIRNIRINVDTLKNPISLSDKNTFVISGLTEGNHLVEVSSKLFLYQMLSIEVRKDLITFYSIHPWTRKKLAKLDKPRIKPLEIINYFEKESGFAIASLLGSWHVLFLIFGAGMMLCYNYVMPKMQAAATAQEPEQQPEPIRR